MNEIVGIGYEGQTLDGFISQLRLRGVQVLIDVRLHAISRKRGFSKTALSNALKDAGIDYLHLPTLGNQRENRPGYASIETTEATAARQRFRSVLANDDAQETLSAVAELSLKNRIALFCFEADENHCHRQQVREAIDQLRSSSLVSAGQNRVGETSDSFGE